MFASYLDPSSSGDVARLVSSLNNSDFSLGNGIYLRSSIINDVYYSLGKDHSSGGSASISSDNTGLSDSGTQNSVSYFLKIRINIK